MFVAKGNYQKLEGSCINILAWHFFNCIPYRLTYSSVVVIGKVRSLFHIAEYEIEEIMLKQKFHV